MLKASLDHLAMVRRGLADGTLPADDSQATPSPRREVETAVPAERLREYHQAIHAMPEGFTLSPKLARQWERRAAVLDQPDGKIDWAHAETLAFAAIISDGTPIRLTGQDAERGTFSQRHLVLHDPKTGNRHTPLETLPTAQASFAVYNSPLSEQAAVGFEYGYSVHAPGRLVLWEGAVRRLRQRRPDHHRPVHLGREEQVARLPCPGHAPAARLRGPGAGTLQRSS